MPLLEESEQEASRDKAIVPRGRIYSSGQPIPGCSLGTQSNNWAISTGFLSAYFQMIGPVSVETPDNLLDFIIASTRKQGSHEGPQLIKDMLKAQEFSSKQVDEDVEGVDKERQLLFKLDRPKIAHLQVSGDQVYSEIEELAAMAPPLYGQDPDDSEDGQEQGDGRLSPCTFMALAQGSRHWDGTGMPPRVQGPSDEVLAADFADRQATRMLGNNMVPQVCMVTGDPISPWINPPSEPSLVLTPRGVDPRTIPPGLDNNLFTRMNPQAALELMRLNYGGPGISAENDSASYAGSVTLTEIEAALREHHPELLAIGAEQRTAEHVPAEAATSAPVGLGIIGQSAGPARNGELRTPPGLRRNNNNKANGGGQHESTTPRNARDEGKAKRAHVSPSRGSRSPRHVAEHEHHVPSRRSPLRGFPRSRTPTPPRRTPSPRAASPRGDNAEVVSAAGTAARLILGYRGRARRAVREELDVLRDVEALRRRTADLGRLRGDVQAAAVAVHRAREREREAEQKDKAGRERQERTRVELQRRRAILEEELARARHDAAQSRNAAARRAAFTKLRGREKEPRRQDTRRLRARKVAARVMVNARDAAAEVDRCQMRLNKSMWTRAGLEHGVKIVEDELDGLARFLGFDGKDDYAELLTEGRKVVAKEQEEAAAMAAMGAARNFAHTQVWVQHQQEMHVGQGHDQAQDHNATAPHAPAGPDEQAAQPPVADNYASPVTVIRDEAPAQEPNARLSQPQVGVNLTAPGSPSRHDATQTGPSLYGLESGDNDILLAVPPRRPAPPGLELPEFRHTTRPPHPSASDALQTAHVNAVDAAFPGTPVGDVDAPRATYCTAELRRALALARRDAEEAVAARQAQTATATSTLLSEERADGLYENNYQQLHSPDRPWQPVPRAAVPGDRTPVAARLEAAAAHYTVPVATTVTPSSARLGDPHEIVAGRGRTTTTSARSPTRRQPRDLSRVRGTSTPPPATSNEDDRHLHATAATDRVPGPRRFVLDDPFYTPVPAERRQQQQQQPQPQQAAPQQQPSPDSAPKKPATAADFDDDHVPAAPPRTTTRRIRRLPQQQQQQQQQSTVTTGQVVQNAPVGRAPRDNDDGDGFTTPPRQTGPGYDADNAHTAYAAAKRTASAADNQNGSPLPRRWGGRDARQQQMGRAYNPERELLRQAPLLQAPPPFRLNLNARRADNDVEDPSQLPQLPQPPRQRHRTLDHGPQPYQGRDRAQPAEQRHRRQQQQQQPQPMPTMLAALPAYSDTESATRPPDSRGRVASSTHQHLGNAPSNETLAQIPLEFLAHFDFGGGALAVASDEGDRERDDYDQEDDGDGKYVIDDDDDDDSFVAPARWKPARGPLSPIQQSPVTVIARSPEQPQRTGRITPVLDDAMLYNLTAAPHAAAASGGRANNGYGTVNRYNSSNVAQIRNGDAAAAALNMAPVLDPPAPIRRQRDDDDARTARQDYSATQQQQSRGHADAARRTHRRNDRRAGPAAQPAYYYDLHRDLPPPMSSPSPPRPVTRRAPANGQAAAPVRTVRFSDAVSYSDDSSPILPPPAPALRNPSRAPPALRHRGPLRETDSPARPPRQNTAPAPAPALAVVRAQSPLRNAPRLRPNPAGTITAANNAAARRRDAEAAAATAAADAANRRRREQQQQQQQQQQRQALRRAQDERDEAMWREDRDRTMRALLGSAWRPNDGDGDGNADEDNYDDGDDDQDDGRIVSAAARRQFERDDRRLDMLLRDEGIAAGHDHDDYDDHDHDYAVWEDCPDDDDEGESLSQ